MARQNGFYRRAWLQPTEGCLWLQTPRSSIQKLEQNYRSYLDQTLLMPNMAWEFLHSLDNHFIELFI
jgi:hypothetical protein